MTLHSAARERRATRLRRAVWGLLGRWQGRRWPELLALPGAIVLGAGLWLALQAPAVTEQRRVVFSGTQDLLAELERARSRLAASAPQEEAASAWPRPTGADEAIPQAPAWHWHRVALDAGLKLELLRPIEADTSRPAQLQLHLRGRYHQHGDFVAALGRHPQGLRLVSYQLQGDPAGLHQAQLRLELPPAGMPVLPALAARPYRPQPSLDPFADPAPADPWAGLPAAWRLEAQRPRELLEGWPLSAFEFTGTLRQDGQWLAMLRLEQRVHVLRAGDYLGPELGRVRRIDEQGLWLRELVRDASGRWSEQLRHWRVGQTP